MAVVELKGAGGCEVYTGEIFIDTDDFILKVNGKSYRIQTDREGELMFALINGVDCKIRNCGGMYGNSYPGVILTQAY